MATTQYISYTSMSRRRSHKNSCLPNCHGCRWDRFVLLVPLSFPTASDPRQDTIQRTVNRDIYSRLRSTKELDDNFPANASWINTSQQSETLFQVLQEHDRYVGQVMLNRNLFIAGDENDAYWALQALR